MKRKVACGRILILLCLLLGRVSFAVEKLVIPNDNTNVYAGPSLKSPVLAVLKKGKTVTAE